MDLGFGFPVAAGPTHGGLDFGFPKYLEELASASASMSVSASESASESGSYPSGSASPSGSMSPSGSVSASESPSGYPVTDDSGIWLGPFGTEIKLPRLRWIDRNAPQLPVTYDNQIENVGQIDGVRRFNLKRKRVRQWVFVWEMLTETELAVFIDLADMNQRLHFQNNWVSPEWHWVAVKSLNISPAIKCGQMMDNRYRVDLVLEQIR